jgi:hypothetical protein
MELVKLLQVNYEHLKFTLERPQDLGLDASDTRAEALIAFHHDHVLIVDPFCDTQPAHLVDPTAKYGLSKEHAQMIRDHNGVVLA